jgi:hypothetical protein
MGVFCYYNNKTIIRLDKFNDDINIMKKFGWTDLDIDKNRKGTKTNSNKNKDISKKIHDYLKIKMKLDIELYNQIYNI